VNASRLRSHQFNTGQWARLPQRGFAEMSSYLVIDTEVIDEDAFSEFVVKIYDAAIAAGGTFLVRGSDLDVVEGDWTPQRLVIMSFDSDDGAGEFVRSTAYTALEELRLRAVRSKVVVAAGYNG